MRNQPANGNIHYIAPTFGMRLVALQPAKRIDGLATLPKDERLMEGYSLYPGMIGFIEVDNAGQIYFRESVGNTSHLRPVGTLYPNGDFSLLNGNRDNIFNSDRMMLDPAWMDGKGALCEELQRYSQSYLQKNKNLSAYVRGYCNDFLRDVAGNPLTGKGSRITIMEQSAANWSNPKSHAAIMADRSLQLAPEATIVPSAISMTPTGALDMREVLLLAKDRKPLTMGGNEGITQEKIDGILSKYQHYDRDFQTMEADMTELVTGELRQFTAAIRDTLKQTPLKPGVINISAGPQGQKIYNCLIEFAYRYPHLRQYVERRFGNGQDGLEGAVARYSEQLLVHPRLKAALGEWQQASRTAAEKGQFIVVSVGNHNRPESHYPGASQVGFNILGMSPYVITVAASDPHHHPDRPELSTLSPISSRGDRQGWHPTLAFWGANLYAEGLRGNAETGTSGATARVSGLIALKLQQNPNITYEQLKRSLETGCVQRPERYTAADYGSGFLDPTCFLAV